MPNGIIIIDEKGAMLVDEAKLANVATSSKYDAAAKKFAKMLAN